MNCKPGDLAIVIRSVAGNEGKIVRCVRSTVYRAGLGFGLRWWTEPVLFGPFGEPQAPLDACLRPIRGSGGTDETLTWAGKPQQLEHSL